MPDLLKTIELASRHYADTKENFGCRPYWVEFDPTIRGQYFSIQPIHMVSPGDRPSMVRMQEFRVMRMSREDGCYRDIFTVEVRRTAPKDAILEQVVPMIHEWLDAQETPEKAK